MIFILSYKNRSEILHRFAMIYHMSKEVARNRADTMPALPAVVNAAVAAKYPHLPSCSILVSSILIFYIPLVQRLLSILIATSTIHLVQHLFVKSPPSILNEVEPNAGRWHRRVQRRRTTARRDFRSKQVTCELSKTYGSAFSTVRLTSRLVLVVGGWLTSASYNLELGVQ